MSETRMQTDAAHSITPHIVVRDAAAAAEWYRTALGAVERRRVPVPDGRLMTVELWFGDSPVMLADEFPEMGVVSPLAIGGTAVVLHLRCDDVEARWGQALEAGATVLHPLAEQFWGEREGQIADPFGHHWNLAQQIREVPDDEIAAAAWRAFGGATPD